MKYCHECGHKFILGIEKHCPECDIRLQTSVGESSKGSIKDSGSLINVGNTQDDVNGTGFTGMDKVIGNKRVFSILFAMTSTKYSVPLPINI